MVKYRKNKKVDGNMKEYNINVRKEKFGATILNLETGKREYINHVELNDLMEKNIWPEDFKLNDNVDNIKFTDKDTENIEYFSFADIAFIEVTRACNLRCKHCLNNSGKVLEKQLTTNEIIKLIEKLGEAGIQEIRFTGGEPLVHKDIYQMIKFATELGIYVSIGTNGTLITKETAQKLKEAGLKRAVISLDGTKNKHDDIRGTGNYDKTIASIDYLKEQEIKIKVNSVIMRSNMDDVIELAKKLNKMKIDLLIRRFIESGRGENLENNTLFKSDYDYVKEQLKEELNSAPYVRGHYIRLKDETANSRIDIPFKIKQSCKAGQRALVFTPNGDIHFCGFLAAQNFPPVGNIRKINDLSDFWNKLHRQNRLDELEENLERYNKIPGIQPTNCLAYVQRMLNTEKQKG